MPKTDTTTDRLAELATLVAARIPALIDEARDQINEAITVAVEDAQSDDKEAVISLPIAIKWNLDKAAITTALGVTVKRRFERVDKLEDPGQSKLPGIDSDANAVLRNFAESVRKGYIAHAPLKGGQQ